MRDALVTVLLAIISFLSVVLVAMALRYERRPAPVVSDRTHMSETTR